MLAISSASVFANVSSSAIAEAVPKHLDRNSPDRTAEVRNDSSFDRKVEKHLVSQRDRSLKSSQKSMDYDIFDVAKDIEITLENADRDIDVENVEWYIEKY